MTYSKLYFLYVCRKAVVKKKIILVLIWYREIVYLEIYKLVPDKRGKDNPNDKTHMLCGGLRHLKDPLGLLINNSKDEDLHKCFGIKVLTFSLY